MSRLPKGIRQEAFGFLLTAFIAWALCLPVLHLLGIAQEGRMALLLALGASLIISLYQLVPGKLRFLGPLLVVAALVLSGLFWPGSMAARLVSFTRAFLSGAGLSQAALLYMDALLPLMMMLLALFARLLMEGDPAFTLPLMVAPVLMLWFLGAREPLSAYFPAILSLPLLYVFISVKTQDSPLIKKPRGLLLRAVALSLALMFLAFSLTPPHRVTQPQAEQMANDLRRRIEDLFFFTATRNMFTLSSQGYQPMGERGLGGRPNISNQPVMNVRSQEKVYLRGTALDTYTGRGWYDTLSSQRYGWQNVRYNAVKTELFNLDLPASERVETRTASITMLHDMPSTLFVPQRLRDITLGSDMVAYFNASSELFITHDLTNGDSYSFRYEPYVAGEARTDALAGKLAQAGLSPVPLKEEYFHLPSHLQPDGVVANLAREIIGAETQPYRQALLLMRHLRTNYAYETQVPYAPENQDFVAHFLFDVKMGYCTYFASAMTVLARSIGLPARYVEGFLANPQGADSVTLTGMNAHAWTEIYVAGLGWVVFDATATQGQDDQSEGDQPPSEGQQPSPSPSPSQSPSPSPSTEPSDQPQDAPTPTPPPQDQPSPEPSEQPEQEQNTPDQPDQPFPWWILLVLATLALLVWQILREEPGRKEKRLASAGAVFSLYYSALLDVNRTGGKGMKAQETPLSYMARVAPRDEEHQEMAGVYSAFIYGKRQPDRDEAAFAGSLYRAAWRGLPWYNKVWLSLVRALMPLRNLGRTLTGFFARRPKFLRKK